jgi:hypothetical protein
MHISSLLLLGIKTISTLVILHLINVKLDEFYAFYTARTEMDDASFLYTLCLQKLSKFT